MTERKKYEEQQAILASIVNFSDDAIISKTLEGIITSWNHGAENIFGYSQEETIGKHISILIPPFLLNEEPEIIEKIKRNEIIHHYETERMRKDGRLINISLTISPLKDSKGNIIGISKIARDITVRRKFEEQKAILASIVDFSDDAIISKTLEGIITSWNHGAEKIFGYSREEIIGKHISILIPPFLLNEEPEIIEKIKRNETIHHYETERVRKDGKVINISLTISPVKDSKGNIIGISKIARDITVRVKFEEEQTILASIVDFSDDAIISKTLEGIIISWNHGAEKIFGYSSEETIGKHISILIPPYRFNEEPEIIEKVKRDEIIDHYETERIRKDGKIINVSLTVSPVKDTKGNIIRISKIARDITERIKFEEQQINLLNNKIEQKNKELESFTYSVSHDLRAPLRAIQGFTQVLSEDYITHLDDGAKLIMNNVINSAKRMSSLIDSLLDFSRIGSKEPERTLLDMNELAHSALRDLENSLPSFKTEIIIHSLPPAPGDYALIKQVFINLISNAIKYSQPKEKPVVEIGSFKEGNETIYYIKDNGVGFNMKYYKKLFEVFQRFHKAEEFEGNGVGLTIVKNIITKHNGRVWAEAEVGKGASFYFSLNKSYSL